MMMIQDITPINNTDNVLSFRYGYYHLVLTYDRL